MPSIAFVQRLLRSPYPEIVTADDLRRGGRYRLWLLLLCCAIDVFIYLTLRGSPAIRQPVLRTFTILNLSLLGLDGLISWLALELANPPRRPAVAVCILLEVLTTVVWIQVTGSASSYFLIMGPALIVVYRGSYTYREGFLCYVSLLLLHAGVAILEEIGTLRPEALWVGPANGLDSFGPFRHIAIISILSTYGMVFLGANWFVNKLRAQERSLAVARHDLALVAEGARHGRLTGVLLGSYALGELLGRGGMGEVYAARSPDGVEVAIKVLHPHLVEQPEAYERFCREAEAGARAPGDHCPRLIEIAQADGLPFIVMEYLRGEDLGAFLRRRGRLRPDEAVKLTHALGAAIDALHAAGLIHRDLKPANVFLVGGDTDWPRVKVLDLGVCKLREAGHTLTGDAALIGTPGFMSPEQARGQSAEVGPAADLFALGAIVYRALTGVLPFPAGDLMQAIDRICHLDPPRPSGLAPELPSDVDRVLAIALAKRAPERYASGGELARDLALAVKGQLPELTRARAAPLLPAAGDAATVAAGASSQS